MTNESALERFTYAQADIYDKALAEVRIGKKRNHWMWFIFPQIRGLGFSRMAEMYGIKDLKEAQAFLEHPDLGKRLITMSNELLESETDNASAIFGSPDDMKLKSCMTLFSVVENLVRQKDMLEKEGALFIQSGTKIKANCIIKPRWSS